MLIFSTLSSDNCDLFTCLLPVIDQAHTLWELILTAEPLGKEPNLKNYTDNNSILKK